MTGLAQRHEISDEAFAHAFVHSIVWVEVGDDPIRVQLAGPDSAGNVLALVVMMEDKEALVIHAMPLRRTAAEPLFGVKIDKTNVRLREEWRGYH